MSDEHEHEHEHEHEWRVASGEWRVARQVLSFFEVFASMHRLLKTGSVQVIVAVLGLMAVLFLIGQAVLREPLPGEDSPDAITAGSRHGSTVSAAAGNHEPAIGDTATAGRGTVQGRILFSGEVRRSPSGGGDFQDVLIYLEGEQPANTPVASQKGLAANGVSVGDAESLTKALPNVAVLDQIDMTFIPHVVTMQAGQILELRNSDTALHNVNGLAVRNPALNIALPPRSVQQVTLSRPEFIRIVCNFHARMSAWIAVLPNRFYTRANADGTFELRGLPAGNHQLSAWQESLYPPHKPVQTSVSMQIRPGQVTQVDLNFP